MYSTQKLVKSAKNSTWPYLNEISPHFIHEIKTKGYDDIGINIFLRTLMRFLRKKRSNPGVTGPYTTTGTLSSASSLNTFRKYWIWCTPSHTFKSHYCMTLEELSLTGSHCKSLSIGEISSNFLVLLTIRAAKFCTAWILFRLCSEVLLQTLHYCVLAFPVIICGSSQLKNERTTSLSKRYLSLR